METLSELLLSEQVVYVVDISQSPSSPPSEALDGGNVSIEERFPMHSTARQTYV